MSSPVAASTPIAVPSPAPRPSPGEVASALTGLLASGGRIVPALSSGTSDATVLEISAPGYYSLLTTRGYLRQKGDRIYLIPLDLDAEFFDGRYFGTPERGYDAFSSQWDARVLGVYVNPAIASSALRASIGTAVNAMSRALEFVGSSVRMEMSEDPNALITVEVSSTITRSVSGGTFANDGRYSRATVHLRDLQPVDSVEFYQILFWVMTHHQIASANRSFTSFPGARTTSPSELDFAMLRVQMNRCGLARLVDDRGFAPRDRSGRESELSAGTCVFPAGN
ncbi:MAG: hypothetical protein ABI672_10285 [Vicinamibacteria bacterium]